MRKKTGPVRPALLLFVAIMIGMALLTQAPAAHAKDVPAITTDICIGHRGARELAPQNTMASFQEALGRGYTSMECDLWYTLSGDILICHGESTKPYTKRNKMIWELSLKNRFKYPIKRGKKVKRHETQYIPSLDEVLKFASENDVRMFLHLKAGKTHFNRKALRKLNRAIKRYSFKEKPVVCTSDRFVMRKMTGYHWVKAFFCKKSGKINVRSDIKFAADKKCTYIFIPLRKKYKPKKPLIRYGHRKGLKIVYYNIRTRKKANKALRKGVDIIMTDRILFRQGDASSK